MQLFGRQCRSSARVCCDSFWHRGQSILAQDSASAVVMRRAAKLPSPPHILAGVAIGCQARSFSTSDGPYRHIKPRFTWKKKHYNEVLTYGDMRKLLETAEDALNQPAREFPRVFWETLAMRCVQSIHFFKPMELAIVARAFDMHDVELRAKYDIYKPIARQARTLKEFPGLAILVLLDILPRRLDVKASEIKHLCRTIGRQAGSVMYELNASHAVKILKHLTSAGVRDLPLCQRVAAKVLAQLAPDSSLTIEELAEAVDTFAGQEHRDVPVLLGIAEAAERLCIDASPDAAATASEAASGILIALEKLQVDGAEVVDRLRDAAKEAAARASSQPSSHSSGASLGDSSAAAGATGGAFSVEDGPSAGGSRSASAGAR